MFKMIFATVFCLISLAVQADDSKYKSLTETELIDRYISSNVSERLFIGSSKTQVEEGINKYRISQGGFFSLGLNTENVAYRFKSWCIQNSGHFDISMAAEDFLAYLNQTQKYRAVTCTTPSSQKFLWLIQEKTSDNWRDAQGFIYVINESLLPKIHAEGSKIIETQKQLDNEKTLRILQDNKAKALCENSERILALKKLKIGNRLDNGDLILGIKGKILQLQDTYGKTYWKPIDELSNFDLYNTKKCEIASRQ